MTLLDAVILSIVEGITEFLPISSTGHLVLTSKLLDLPPSDFLKSFEIAIQLGAIIAVVALYWQKITLSKKLWTRVLLAFLPTGVLGFIFYKPVKENLLNNSLITLIALFFGGVIMIVLEMLYREKDHHVSTCEQISRKQAFVIGLFQSAAMIPGVSRAAATIIGSLFLGVKRTPAVEFSFLLAIPTIAAATGFDLLRSSFTFSSNELQLLAVGFLGSFFVAFLTIKWFIQFTSHHTFISFGIYRIILALLFGFVIFV